MDTGLRRARGSTTGRWAPDQFLISQFTLALPDWTFATGKYDLINDRVKAAGSVALGTITRALPAPAEREFAELVKGHRDWDLVLVFQSHPAMIKTEWFWDRNYYAGANTEPADWQISDYSSDYDLAKVRDNWALHCANLREDTSIELTTAGECTRLYGDQAPTAAAGELQVLAALAADCHAPSHTDRFSAAEILDLLARGYLSGGACG